MKWILIAIGILVLLVGIVVLIGYLLPEKHTVSISRTFDTQPEIIWDLIHDFEKYANWRSSLKEVAVQGDDTWAEINDRNEKLTLKIIDTTAPRKMVTKIIDENLPFGGTWTFEIKTDNGQTRLTITEDGEIYNVVFRFFARFIFGYEATIKQYFEDLSNAVKN